MDQFGNLVSTDSSNVTVALAANPAGGTLSGTTTVAAVNGLATFSNLSLDKAVAGYTLQVTEGDVFHLGDLDIQGLDPKTTDRLREAWTLREADPYDSTYPKRFFDDTVKLLARDVTWTISIHEGVNEEDKTVDVSLRYGIKPP